MKGLLIAGDVNRIGGIEKYNRDFYSALLQAGVSAVLVERREGGLPAKISFVCRVVLQFLRQRPDIIFCGHLNFSPVGLFLKLIFGTPYTVALYAIEIIEDHGWLKRKSVRAAARIITISGYAKGLILRQYPDLSERIFMLPSAVDGSVFVIKEKSQELLDRFGIVGQPIILSLARLASGEHKGQDRVLASLPYVLERIPNAVYLIVGGGTDDRVTAVLESNPELLKSVIFTGPAPNEERVDFYNLGDVYVLPSKYDGPLIVHLEALACGVPVIASDAFGVHEWLLGGEVALLVPPDDLKAIAGAIVSILEKRVPNALLYDRGYLRRRILEVYGIETWNERVKDLVKVLFVCLA